VTIFSILPSPKKSHIKSQLSPISIRPSHHVPYSPSRFPPSSMSARPPSHVPALPAESHLTPHKQFPVIFSPAFPSIHASLRKNFIFYPCVYIFIQHVQRTQAPAPSSPEIKQPPTGLNPYPWDQQGSRLSTYDTKATRCGAYLCTTTVAGETHRRK
jgi:hypothetical protein